MKTIIYILLGVFMSSILISAIPQPQSEKEFKQLVILESFEDQVIERELIKSKEILSERLSIYGLKDFEFIASFDQNRLQISFSEDVDLREISRLLISKGEVEFYETYNSKDVIELLNPTDQLFSVLNINPSDSNKYLPIIGCSKRSDILEASEYVFSKNFVNQMPNDLRLLWGEYPNSNNEFDLFALKFNSADNHYLNSDNIIDAKIERTEGLSSVSILIEFDESGTKLFEDLTKKNLNKSIAIVLDDFVYSFPKVKSEIKGGKCIISGNYSKTDAKRLVAILKSGELPLGFKIVK